MARNTYCLAIVTSLTVGGVPVFVVLLVARFGLIGPYNSYLNHQFATKLHFTTAYITIMKANKLAMGYFLVESTNFAKVFFVNFTNHEVSNDIKFPNSASYCCTKAKFDFAYFELITGEINENFQSMLICSNLGFG